MTRTPRASNPPLPVDVVVRHPRIEPLGRTPREQRRVERFAVDIARWLVGEPRDSLGPLARVVTVVANRELRDPKRLCRDRPLLAVESAARAVEALWPLLRGPLEEEREEPSPPPPPPPEGGDGGAGGESGDEPDEPGDEGADDEAAMGMAGGGAGGGDAGEAEGEAEGEGQPGGEAEPGEGEPGEGEGEPGEGEGEPGEGEPGEGEGEPDAGEGELDPDALPSTEDLLAAIAEEDGIDDPELAAFAERLKQAMGDAPADEMSVGAAASEVLSQAAEAALSGALESERASRYLEHLVPGVGWGYAPGQLHETLLERLDRLTVLLGQLEQLEELADALGRLEAADRKEGEEHGGSEEVVGVMFGGNVAYALPSELGLLGDPETEDLFYQRLIEHRLLSLELTGGGMDGSAAADKRGPVIACIDTSGSMEGPPEMAAKALVLALCRRVLPQGRTVHLMLFSGAEDRVEIRLRKGLGGLEGLLDFLAMSFQGGTDFDKPLERALELLEEKELHKADILVVTDGLARAGPETVAAVEDARQRRGLRVWSVVLGLGDPFGVRPFSDEVWRLDPTRAVEAAGLLRKVDG